MSTRDLLRTFKRSSLAPTDEELLFLSESIAAMHLVEPNVLEFGCGITTAVTITTLHSCGIYVAVETYLDCVRQIKTHYPEVQIAETWKAIPRRPYNLLLVDSSVGHAFEQDGVYRLEAFMHVEELLSDNCWIVMHDHHRAQKGYARFRRYLDENYSLHSHCEGKSGFGVYRKGIRTQR